MNDNSIDGINSFLNVSQRSINFNQQEYEHKYKTMYQEISNLRTNLRQYQHNNVWLKNQNEGLIEENKILKELLKQKKQLIRKINLQLKQTNKEINRLEDQLMLKITQISQVQKIIQNLKLNLMQNQNQLQIQRLQIDKLKNDYNNLQLQNQNTINYIQNDIKNNQSNNLNKCQEKVLNFIKQNSFINLQQKQINVQKLEIDQKIHHSLSFQVSNYENLIDKVIKEANKLIIKLNDQEQQFNNYKQKSIQFQESLCSKNNVVQQQLRSLTDLLMQQKQQEKNEIINYKQKQITLQQNIKKIVKKIQDIKKYFDDILLKLMPVIGIQLGNILNKFIESVMIEIIEEQQINKSNNILFKNYEDQFIFVQISKLCKQFITQQDKNNKIIEDYYNIRNKYIQVKENLDITELKYNTLERSYEEIIDDNSRLLKFHQLSKFRERRNVYKQNMNISNIEFQKN